LREIGWISADLKPSPPAAGQMAATDAATGGMKVSLEAQQAEVVRTTQAAGGDMEAALAKFHSDHAAELAAREATEAAQINVQSYERHHMRLKAGERISASGRFRQN
jgi:hypothetical protein